MEANPLDRLRQRPEAYAPFFDSSDWSDTTGIAEEDLALLRQSEGYFDSWRQTLEERLNEQRSDEAANLRACRRTQGRECIAAGRAAPRTRSRSGAMDPGQRLAACRGGGGEPRRPIGPGRRWTRAATSFRFL